MFKLVRDRIPELIQKSGQICNYAEVKNKELFIGLRPEFVKVSEDGKYEVEVEMVEYIGRDKSIIFHFAGQENTCKAIIPSEINVEAGDKVKVNFSRFFVFAKDGTRLV